MKTILRLGVLALVGTAALALAGTALAKQTLSVKQDATSLTIKISQAQTDPQPAKITVYVPSGYTINASATPGSKIGTTTGSIFARDLNIPLPLSGDVIVAPPSTNAPGCATGTHLAVWLLALQVAGQAINLPVHVDQTTGAEAALGAYKLVICLGPADVPLNTPGRSPNGAQLLEATFAVSNIFTSPATGGIWKTITTPYAAGLPAPNPAGTVETRSFVSNGSVTLASKVISAKKRIVRFTGKVTQAGVPVTGTQVSILINGAARFRAKTNASGGFTVNLKKTGSKAATTFQARVTAAERDITTTGCTSPTPGVPLGCVSATASPFTAVSRKIKVRV